MHTYNWQQPDWPHFTYDLTDIQETLLLIAEKTGLIKGKLSLASQQLQAEAMLDLMVEEAIKTSEIEGEYISRPDIRSSLKNQLGLKPNIFNVHDKRAQGIAALMVDVRNTFNEPLSATKLFDWHVMLMSGSIKSNIQIGGWRTHTEPMQIISGSYGNIRIHFEAPPSYSIPKEMDQFIAWFNKTAPNQPEAIKFAPVRAAIAHLYFESIHPFEDGNGRIGRALAEKTLSQGLGHPALLSLSHAMEAEKKYYYQAIHKASHSNNITAWIHYFVNTILKSQIAMEAQINFILKKAKFFDQFPNSFNERQLKVIKRILDEGAQGFEGGMSAKKYIALTGTSKATATRDLQELHDMGIFKQIGSGRSVHYELILDQNIL